MEKPREGVPDIMAQASCADIMQPPLINAATVSRPLAAKDPGKSKQTADARSSESTRREGCNEWWLVVLTTSRRGIREHDVRVQEDTGTPVNWVHPDVIRNCNLGSLEEACASRSFVDMRGKKFKCDRCLRITWYGRNRNSYEELFFVSPQKAPIHMVLGDEFVTKHGRVKEICADRRKAEDARVFVATSQTEEQEQQMKENETEHNKQSAEIIAQSQQGKNKPSPKDSGGLRRREEGKSSHSKK